MKILINTPDLSLAGGVANHYKGLRDYWNYDVDYNFIGGRKGIPGPLVLIYDYFKFFLRCFFKKPQVVILNPSLGKTAIKRDALFLKIAKVFNIKTLVFFHGWNEDVVAKLNKNPRNFIVKFNKADGIIVLAELFKNQLKTWGVYKPIFLTTTKFDDKLIETFNVDKKKIGKTILFLARLEENKGIFITLKAFKKILQKHPQANLIVAGNGSALSSAKEFTNKNKIFNVEFLGNISNDKLINTFKDASLYILPTTHGEGMPTSVLEAMAFGLPIVSRPVGGLVDFFEDEKMGCLVNSLDPKVYSDKIHEYFMDSKKMESMSLYNNTFAKERFAASKVAQSLEKIIDNVYR